VQRVEVQPELFSWATMGGLTSLMNADPAGTSNQFYTLAKKPFVAAGSTVVDAPTNSCALAKKSSTDERPPCSWLGDALLDDL
jgi:hypothetical protein